jgi:hypothetical protein
MDATPKLVFVSALDEMGGSRRHHAREAERGRQVRVARGAYLDMAEWNAADERTRHILRIQAESASREVPFVVSHWSAAAIHGIPFLGGAPEKVHFTRDSQIRSHASGTVKYHYLPLGDDDMVQIDGLTVTSVARTLVDLAVSDTFISSVTALDSALHIDRRGKIPPLTTVEEVEACFEARMPIRAHSKARKSIQFSVTEADTPLESVSRVNMYRIGCPKPLLQQRFDDHRGLIGVSEFFWEESAKVGEADGKAKYTDSRYRRGRSLEQVLLDEKERADRIRALGLDVSRWGWATALDPDKLRRHLVAAGLPMGHPWRV